MQGNPNHGMLKQFRIVQSLPHDGTLPAESGYSKWRSTVWKDGIYGKSMCGFLDFTEMIT